MKLNLETLTLKTGKHSDPEQGVCIMEAVSIAAGEPFTDFPACTDRAIARGAQSLNDRMPENLRNELLKPLIFKMIGTAGSKELTQKRLFIVADWAVRVFAPIALEASGYKEQASILRGLSPIIDTATALAGKKAAAAAADAANATDAAYAAAAYAADAYAADSAAAYAAAAAADADAKSKVWNLAVKMLIEMIEAKP